MRTLASIAIGIIILATAAGLAFLLVNSKEEPDEVTPKRPSPAVNVLTVEKKDVPIEVPSQGVVEPWRETRLASVVAGRVIAVSDKLEAGTNIKKGDELVTIDPTDYEAALAQAQSRVAEAQLALDNELAASAQAKRDWQRLGNADGPPPLAARVPQLAAARAVLEATKKSVIQAEKNLKRTHILAPFDGRIRHKLVEVGTVVIPGTAVAEIFATGSYKLRLPISLDDAARVFRPDGVYPAVELTSTAGGITARWPARIVRSEGEIDRSSRSVYLVAEVEGEGKTMDDMAVPMLPGMFLYASIEGHTIPHAVVLPREAFPFHEKVLVIDKENVLHLRAVHVAWGGRKYVIVDKGLEEGERVCLTTVEGFIDGATTVTPIKPDEETTAAPALETL